MSSLTPSTSTRRNQLIAGGVAAALVAAIWLLTGNSGTSDVASSDSLILAQSDDAAEEEAAAEELEAVTLQVTYDVFLGRDPFETIRPPEPVSAPDNGGSTDGGDGGSGDGGSDNGDTGGDGSNGDTSNGGTSNGGTSNGGTSNGEIVIEILEVSSDGAVIRIGTTVYEPSVGETFAANFRLLRVLDGCVELQQGDRVMPIQCVGETSFK